MKSSGIGGQAVLEGVMMKNKSKYAVAVRKPDGEISIHKGNCKSISEKNVFFRLPIIRGVVAFVESLVLGMKSLTYSSSFYEEEKTKNEKKSADSKKEAKKKLTPEEEKKAQRKEMMENVLVVILSILLTIVVFMILPFVLSGLLRSKIESEVALTIIEGIIRVVLFVGYVMAISLMSDIKRVFMYHGAEHKTINCVESGLPLNVANVKLQSKEHRRCGTSFLLIVMFVSILFFIFIQVEHVGLRMLLRVLLVPVIAGISYEFIRFAGNTDNKVVIALSKPGLLLQKLTTREPDDDMIEVAIASVNAVFDWEEYQRRCKAQAKRKAKKAKESSETKKEAGVKKDSSEKKKKSRAQLKKEMQEREQAYRNRAEEREKRDRAQEKREAELEQKYKEMEARKAARMAAVKGTAPAPKVEVEDDDDLLSLDRYFDEDADTKK